MCPFPVRVPAKLLADFLESLIAAAVSAPRRAQSSIALQLNARICLRVSSSLCFNPLFRQGAGVSLLRLRFAPAGSSGILTASAIALAFSRLMLRSRLTPNRLTLSGNPWSFGGNVSRIPYRYSCLHLLFYTLQPRSRSAFRAYRMLPYRRPCSRPAASAAYFIPDYYPCRIPRLVSCYALFE